MGASGFIGGHIARAALDQGWEVRGLRRNPEATGHLGRRPVDWRRGNLVDEESLVNAMQGVQVVFHAAAYYPTRKDPRSLSEQVAYACSEIDCVWNAATRADVRRLVFTSTLTTIGRPPPGSDRLANESDHYQPGSLARSAYYEAKYAMESALLAKPPGGLEVVVLNPTAVFGPGDVHLTLGGLLLAVARGRIKFWLRAPINVIDVRDVASAHLQAARQGKPDERYILGGYNMSMRAALEQAARVAGVSPPRIEIPLWLIDAVVAIDDALPAVNLSGNHLRAIRHWPAYDNSKAVAELGLELRPFDQTVADALDWFRANGYLQR